jgi:flagellar basal body P-ring protein FlgI
MFDTYHTSTAASYPQTIHEHKAPTDESIRLFKELEEKALASIVSKLTPPGNVLTGVVLEKACVTSLTREIIIAFELNHKKYKFAVEISDSLVLDPKQAFVKLAETIAQTITEQLLDQLVECVDSPLL